MFAKLLWVRRVRTRACRMVSSGWDVEWNRERFAIFWVAPSCQLHFLILKTIPRGKNYSSYYQCAWTGTRTGWRPVSGRVKHSFYIGFQRTFAYKPFVMSGKKKSINSISIFLIWSWTWPLWKYKQKNDLWRPALVRSFTRTEFTSASLVFLIAFHVNSDSDNSNHTALGVLGSIDFGTYEASEDFCFNPMTVFVICFLFSSMSIL